jgi:hypothetical protein
MWLALLLGEGGKGQLEGSRKYPHAMVEVAALYLC